MTKPDPDQNQELHVCARLSTRREGLPGAARRLTGQRLATLFGAWLSAQAAFGASSFELGQGSTSAPAIDLTQSVKCFDLLSPCATEQTVTPGSTVTYVLLFVNSGPDEATSVRFEDDLTDLGPGCLVTPIADAECVPDGGCHGHPCTVVRQPSATQPFSASISNMPAGCAVQVTIRATVETGTTGTCCNEGLVSFTEPAPGGSFTTPPACFTMATSTRCNLNRVVVLDVRPTTYSNTCSTTDLRLPGPPFVPAVGTHQDLPDTVPGGLPGELSLYQLDCACADVIFLATRRSAPASGVVHISY